MEYTKPLTKEDMFLRYAIAIRKIKTAISKETADGHEAGKGTTKQGH